MAFVKRDQENLLVSLKTRLRCKWAYGREAILGSGWLFLGSRLGLLFLISRLAGRGFRALFYGRSGTSRPRLQELTGIWDCWMRRLPRRSRRRPREWRWASM